MSKEVDIYSIYNMLRDESGIGSDIFNVKTLPNLNSHRLGISEDGCPIFFVKCSDTNKTSDIRLEMVDVLFNRECKIKDINSGHEEIITYTIIQLKNSQEDFQKYFINVVFLVLTGLEQDPSTFLLKKEIAKLIQLFNGSKDLSLEVIQGFWAELFVIEQASDPTYLINSWHVIPEGRFDFNDSIDKVEVKSASKDKRSHLFSWEQLKPNPSAELIIASVFVIQTGLGKNILELVESIKNKINDNDALSKLQQMVLKTIGVHFDKVKELFFDYGYAVNMYALFNSKDIPTIHESAIPEQISQLHFRVDLTNIESTSKEAYESKLINSL